MAASVALIFHLAAFGFLFREQDTSETLIPEEDDFLSEEPTSDRSDEPDRRKQSRSTSAQRLCGKGSSQNQKDTRRDGGEWANVPQHVLSSQSELVESPLLNASFNIERPSNANLSEADESGQRKNVRSTFPSRGSAAIEPIPEQEERGQHARPGMVIALPDRDA